MNAAKPPIAELHPFIWKRIPLAKRRLILEGPGVPGRDAFRDACICVAAELALGDVPPELAEAVCMQMPLVTGKTPAHKVYRQVPGFVRWAYNPPDGAPIMSGCADTEHRYTTEQRTRLRDSFTIFCDEECARTCVMRRGGLVPETALLGSRYEHVLFSSIWTKLTPASLLLWRRLAAIAAVGQHDVIRTSQRWLVATMNGVLTRDQIRYSLKQLEEAGLIEATNRNDGYWLIPTLTEDQLQALEDASGARDEALWRVREARNEWLTNQEDRPLTDAEKWQNARDLGVDPATEAMCRQRGRPVVRGGG